MPHVFDRIQAFNSSRIPALLQLKYRFISEDPFRFFRGTCHLFYEDLARHRQWPDDTKAWICGDLHLENFGSYKGDNRIVYFDMNDFDEALLAPVTWELVRLLTSIYVAGYTLPYNAATAEALCKAYLDKYLQVLRNGKPVVIEKETANGLLHFFLQQVQNRKEKAFVQTRTQVKKGAVKLLIDGKKSLAAPAEIKENILHRLNHLFNRDETAFPYKAVDLAYRVAGTGSVGVQRYVILAQDRNNKKLHLLDLKEARPSSLQPYIPIPQPDWKQEADRVISLQKRVQHVSPALLHALTLNGTAFVLKELQPTADRMDLSLCKGKLNKLSSILCTMAEITASGQLRATGRQGSSIADELMAFAANAAAWKKEVLAYAKRYAQQVMTDYKQYGKAYHQQ